MKIIFIISIICNILLIGILLITQFVTYPSFKYISENEFSKFHNNYNKKMLLMVGPIMSVEFLFTVILFVSNSNFLTALILVSLIWVLTFLFIVPIHNQLEKSYDYEQNKKLIKLNGYRTCLWTIKFIFLICTI